MSDIGHNSGGVAADRLRLFVQRIERLEAEKAEYADDIRKVYAEAKGDGFDVKTLRDMVRERKLDEAERREREELRELYRRALGDLADTPLGAAAMEAA